MMLGDDSHDACDAKEKALLAEVRALKAEVAVLRLALRKERERQPMADATIRLEPTDWSAA